MQPCHRSLLRTPCLLLLGFALAACSSDSGSSEEGSGASGGNSAGKGGVGGTLQAGNGGSSGSQTNGGQGGIAGQGGKAGKGGNAGNAGTGNAGGSNAGAGGSTTAGAGGDAGQGGSTTAGAGGDAGQGGNTTAGQGGSTTAGQGGSTDPGPVVSLVMVPGQAQIDLVDGVGPTVSFSVFNVYQDGSQSPINDATWSVKPGDIALVDNKGTITATGSRAGNAVVAAESGGLKTEGYLKVTLSKTIVDPSISPGDIATLDGASTPDGNLLYPYEGVVYPRGLPSPSLMWNSAATGDKVLIEASNTFATVKTYLTLTKKSAEIDAASWTQLTESGSGGDLHVKVMSLPAGSSEAHIVGDQTWKIASGSLRGTVYYWAINTGRVMRIKPGATKPDDFLGPQVTCPSCHTVSPNGTTLVMNTGSWPNETSVSYDLVGGQNSFSGLFTTSGASEWALAGVSADGSVVVQNFSPQRGPIGKQTGAFDSKTGAKINDSGLDGLKLHMPAFSPDNKLIAYVHEGTGALHVLDWDPIAKKASNDRQLVPGGNTIQFPTISPDHKWVAYQRGNGLGSQGTTGNLYLASVNQPGIEIPLAALNGTTYPFGAGNRDRDLNYEPTFAPLAAGGYYWIVFHSRRTYGNALTKAAYIAEGNGVKQLWVAAIDQNPQPDKDPSHPALWVPGQDISTLNMRGYWAFDPCKPDGASCGGASECCGGACLPGTNTCGEPPGQSCKPVGATCETANDCCNSEQGYQCINNHCTENKP